MNLVILRGNVGQDPRITRFENGGCVAQFSLATTERGFKTRDGEEVPEMTDWHSVVCKQEGLCKVIEDYVKKGTPLLIRGMLRTREYQDNSGTTRYITEVVVKDMELLGKRPEQAPAPTQYDRPAGMFDNNDPFPAD